MYISNQLLQLHHLSMVAGWIQCIFRICNTGLVLPMSMCSNIFCFADLQSYTRKKDLWGRWQGRGDQGYQDSRITIRVVRGQMMEVDVVSVDVSAQSAWETENWVFAAYEEKKWLHSGLLAGVSSENDLLHGKKSQIRQIVCDAEEDLKGSGVGTAAHWNISERDPGGDSSRRRWGGWAGQWIQQ